MTSLITVMFLPGNRGTTTWGIFTPRISVIAVLHAHPLVVDRVVPLLELHLDLDPLLHADGPDAEDGLHVDDPTPRISRWCRSTSR